MTPISPVLISDIRAASRALVRQFGLMNKTVAGSHLPLSSAHALIEIGQSDNLSARDLSQRLYLEKSTVSRLVKSLVERGEICETRSSVDARVKLLKLTDKGQDTLDGIHRFAQSQVASAIAPLSPDQREEILAGLQHYSMALNASANDPNPAVPQTPVQIRSGYHPTLVGRTVDICVEHLHRSHGFGAPFESKIATDMSDFVRRLDKPMNQNWSVHCADRIEGSISIDGESIGGGIAQLRWFVVSHEMRNRGAGTRLLDNALAFCDAQEFRETHLWTVRGLDEARSLYEARGFKLVEEFEGDQWGPKVLEQRFVRPHRA